jgi:hypothetical protein
VNEVGNKTAAAGSQTTITQLLSHASSQPALVYDDRQTCVIAYIWKKHCQRHHQSAGVSWQEEHNNKEGHRQRPAADFLNKGLTNARP